jgi:hypothetical protein
VERNVGSNLFLFLFGTYLQKNLMIVENSSNDSHTESQHIVFTLGSINEIVIYNFFGTTMEKS